MAAFLGCIPDFQLANPLYIGATVTFFTVNPNGTATETLAALYADPQGLTAAVNPQTLDSEGKFSAPVYIKVPVIAQVTGPEVPSHTTGVISDRGTWKGMWSAATPAYYANDCVSDPGGQNIVYFCVSDHTPGTFATDLANGLWELAISGGTQFVIAPFPTIAGFEGTTIAANVVAAQIQGYYAAGDGGAMLLTRVSSEPSHPACFRSTDRYLPNGSVDPTNGGWWVISVTNLNVRQLGAKGDGSTPDTTAFINTLAAAIALRLLVINIPAGSFKITSTISWSAQGIEWNGAGRYATRILYAPTGAGACFSFSNGSDQDFFGGAIRDMEFYSSDVTNTKTAISLQDMNGFFEIERILIYGSYAGPAETYYWSAGSGGSSIGILTAGRDFITLRDIQVYADLPIVVAPDPNISTISIDESRWTDLALIAANGPGITIESGVTWTRWSIDKVWIGAGTHGIYYNDTSGKTSANQLLSIKNFSTEQGIGSGYYSLYFASTGSENQLIIVDGAVLDPIRNGIFLRDAYGCSIRNVVFVGTGISYNIDSSVGTFSVDNCFSGGAPTVTGQSADFYGTPLNGSLIPCFALYNANGTGNRGIGTASPVAPLHVGNSAVLGGGENATYSGAVALDCGQVNNSQNGVEWRASNAGSGYGWRAATVTDGGAHIDWHLQSRQNSASWTDTLVVSGSTGSLTIFGNAIGTTPTDGLVLENTTAAASGAPQQSPSLRFTAQGWRTNSGGASVETDWAAFVLPNQGSANPENYLVFQSQVGGGGYSIQVQFAANSVLIGNQGTSGGILYLLAAAGGSTALYGSNPSGPCQATLPANTGIIAELNLAQSWTAAQTFDATVNVSGASFGLRGNISSAAWTTAGIRYANVAATLTDTTSSGTVALAYTDLFGGNTIAASSAVTYTNYYNTYIKAPVAGTNVTLTNKYALGADSANFTSLAIGGTAETFPASGNIVGTTDTQALTGKTYNGLTITTSTGTLTIGNGKTYVVSNSLTFTGVDGTSFAFPGTSDTVAVLAAANAFIGNNSFSGTSLFTGTTTPTMAAGDLFIGGVMVPPTFGASGEGAVYLSSANGLILQGQGSNYDFQLLNKNGSVIFQVATGTTNVSVQGNLTAESISPTSSTKPSNGLYIPASNQPGISASATLVQTWTSTNVNITIAGSASAPAFSIGNATTGFYSVSTTGLGVSVNGTLELDWGITTSSIWTFASSVALADAKNIAVGTTTGTQIATATSQKLGFFGTTPVVQQAGATPAATTAVTTAATSTTPFGYATSTQANNITSELASTVTAVNALITQLAALGLIA